MRAPSARVSVCPVACGLLFGPLPSFCCLPPSFPPIVALLFPHPLRCYVPPLFPCVCSLPASAASGGLAARKWNLSVDFGAFVTRAFRGNSLFPWYALRLCREPLSPRRPCFCDCSVLVAASCCVPLSPRAAAARHPCLALLEQANHTILLAQFSAVETSRTYYDFDTMKRAVEREYPPRPLPCL